MQTSAVTAAFRVRVPAPARLRTHRTPGDDFLVIMHRGSAMRLGLGNPAGLDAMSEWLTERLGEPVHVAGSPRISRQSALVLVRPGTCAGGDCRPPAERQP